MNRGIMPRMWKKIGRSGRHFAPAWALLLAACTSANTPTLEPPGRPLPPPGELFRQADVNAEDEIDPDLLATLPPDARGEEGATRPAPPRKTAAPAGRERQAGDLPPPRKEQAVVRIGSVAVLGVSGAPGRGNAQLARALRLVLRKAGWPVHVRPRKDSMRISGKVELGPRTPRGQRVRIAWRVETPNGKLLGVVRQDNVVRAGLLDEGFDEMALPAAEGAAEGIFKLVRQLR